jgi:hypothetical protein
MLNKAEADREREAFETWAVGDDGGWMPHALNRNHDGHEFDYADDDVQAEWRVWQARATTPPAPAPSTLAGEGEQLPVGYFELPTRSGSTYREVDPKYQGDADVVPLYRHAVPRQAAVASPLSEKHECVIRLAAKAVVNRGHEGDAKLADSLIGVLAHLKRADGEA